MPKVKGKKFPYTPEGEAAAAEYAQKTGGPFQMRAKGFNNSPMQKNFGSSLAINKKLDNDGGTGKTGQPGPIMKKIDVTSKLEKSNMEGGLTGKPGIGKLDGPMKKKMGKNAMKPTGPKLNTLNTRVQTAGKKFGSDVKTGIAKAASKIGLKKSGNIGAKLKNKYSSSAQRANKVAKPGESQFQFKNRTRKSTPKAAAGTSKLPTKKSGNIDWGKSAAINPNITIPKSKPYVKPKSKIQTKANEYLEFTIISKNLS